MEKLKCKVIFWENFHHSQTVSIELCGLIIHTDLNPFREIQEEEIYGILTSIIFDLEEEEFKELITIQEENEFNPHRITNEQEVEVKYFNDIGFLESVIIQ